MKFFNWMQTKFINGGQQNISKPNGSVPASCVRSREPPKEELIGHMSDGGLLTIGTLGNQHVPENHQDNRRQSPPVENPEEINLLMTPDLTEFTPDEFGKLQKELTKLLKRKPKSAAAAAAANTNDDSQPLDRFLNCPSSLSTLNRTISSSRYSTNSSIIIANDIDQIIEDEEEDDDIDRTIRIIIGRCKEVSKMNKGIFGKKSVSFLLKKIFLCSTSGHFVPVPAPGLRDTIQQSRMEKLLRTLMISKKMYQTPHNGYRASLTKKILDKEDENDQVLEKKVDDSHKWVKTDSEYIVLDFD